jgi:hypothetical protein
LTKSRPLRRTLWRSSSIGCPRTCKAARGCIACACGRRHAATSSGRQSLSCSSIRESTLRKRGGATVHSVPSLLLHAGEWAGRPSRGIITNVCRGLRGWVELTSVSGWARWSHALLLLGVLVMVGVGLYLSPDPAGHGTHQQLGLPPCTIHFLTGRPCPFLRLDHQRQRDCAWAVRVGVASEPDRLI